MIKNTRETYGLVAQLLHWLTAALILSLIPLGVYMHELPVSTATEVADKSWLYSLHKTLGVTVFFVAILRVLWAVTQPHPRLLNGDKKLESLAAQTVHWVLYGAIILMPLTGWLHHSAAVGFAPIWWPLPQDLPMVPKSPSLAAFFGLAHFLTGALLGLSLMLHVGGALKHALIDKDATLNRMLPGQYRAQGSDLPNPPHKRASIALAAVVFATLGSVAWASFALNEGKTGPTQALAEVSKPGEWVIDKEKSRLGISIIQSGSPVGGAFGEWTASIIFDPDNLPASSLDVQVAVASLSVGSVSQQAISADFLNAPLHPVGRFQSDRFTNTADGQYQATGTLQLAGVSKPFTLPFSLKIVEGRAFVKASASINRLDFDIGKKGFASGKEVGLAVMVNVELEAVRNQPSSSAAGS